LVSAYDKTGIGDLAKGLAEFGVRILSTGRTKAIIEEAGVEATAVEDHTGFPDARARHPAHRPRRLQPVSL
jgi:phosphoribosylaminoimidazolecarboxamide formyltransferase/IMP cyclohydrolase